MAYYRTCPLCGSNNDPGEACDCRETKKEAAPLHRERPRANAYPLPVYQPFCPKSREQRKAAKKDAHRLTCRISARLETADYEALQQLIAADGYATTQDWLTAIVRRYIAKAGDAE